MKKFSGTVGLAFVAALTVSAAYAQTTAEAQSSAVPPVIFAVIGDGKTIEPIALVENRQLVIEDERSANPNLTKNYYRPGTKYNLIFGGSPNGTVAVKRSNVGTECGGSSADVVAQSEKAKLAGFVMALATNLPANRKATGIRRSPTVTERAEIEALVRNKFRQNKVAASALKQLRYYNLTAVDIDGDGRVEMVGSYWVAPGADRRELLFFIAERTALGKFEFTYTDKSTVTADDLMSGDLKDLDTMGGELLLDILDYDADGISEIFTIEKAFEGNNYHVYHKSGKQWTKVIDAYVYRCAY
jgi:hypothetical protein